MKYTKWIAVSLLGSNNLPVEEGNALDSSILYEEKYSQLIQSALNSVGAEQHEDEPCINTDDYIRKLITESVCVIMPERMEERNYFIYLAKEITIGQQMRPSLGRICHIYYG